MGWYDLVSLVSDSRIKFLLAFVLVAIIAAFVITILEIRLKKKRALLEVKSEDLSYISKIRKILKSEKTSRQKLDLIDEVVKRYFKENFGTNLNLSYSQLIKEFEKTNHLEPLNYSKKMFSLYYNRREIDGEKVESLAKEFIDLIRKREKESEVFKTLSFNEKVNNFFVKRKDEIFNYFRAWKSKWKRIQRKKHKELLEEKEIEKKKNAEAEHDKLIQERNENLKKEKKGLKLFEKETGGIRLDGRNSSAVVDFKIKEPSRRIALHPNQLSLLDKENSKTKVEEKFFLRSENSKDESGLKSAEIKKLEEFENPNKEDWKVVKDSFEGNLEMYPPVNKSKSSDIIQKLGKS